MATEKEEIILEFKIDQGAALKDLEKVEKAILNNKEAQKELNDAYKKSLITQEEYIEENIRLQQNIKKEQDQKRTLTKLIDTESNSRNALKARVSQLSKEYDNLNLKTAEGQKRSKELEKELSTLNNQISKTSKSAGLFKDQIGNYPEAFKNAASGINVAGVSVGDIGAKLAAFANPATAALGIVTALGAAYARSTIGAKDLEFAQNQLSASITLATNQFARLISSAEDGEGILSQITTAVTGAIFGLNNALTGKLIALNLEKLEDLGRDEIGIRETVNERLEENQEKLTELQAEQTTYNDKIGLTNEIIGNLRKNEEELLDIQGKQLEILETNLALNKEDEVAQTAVLEKNREISNIKRDTEKRVQAILRMEQNITEAENKRLAILREQNRLLANADARLANKSKGITGLIDLSDPKKSRTDAQKTQSELDAQEKTRQIIETGQIEVDALSKINADKLKLDKDYYKKTTEDHAKMLEIRNQAEITSLDYTADILGSLSQLFKQGGEEYRAIASLQTIISTYTGATKAYESQASIPYVGPELGAIAAAAAIVSGLANLAVINGVQFAEGGYTGSGGKYEPAGTVHKGEVVWNQTDVALSGGPQVADRMRPTYKGYADGGIVTGALTQETNSAVIQANAIKNMPTPEVSVKEITKVQKRVKVKENISTL